MSYKIIHNWVVSGIWCSSTNLPTFLPESTKFSHPTPHTCLPDRRIFKVDCYHLDLMLSVLLTLWFGSIAVLPLHYWCTEKPIAFNLASDPFNTIQKNFNQTYTIWSSALLLSAWFQNSVSILQPWHLEFFWGSSLFLSLFFKLTLHLGFRYCFSMWFPKSYYLSYIISFDLLTSGNRQLWFSRSRNMIVLHIALRYMYYHSKWSFFYLRRHLKQSYEIYIIWILFSVYLTLTEVASNDTELLIQGTRLLSLSKCLTTIRAPWQQIFFFIYFYSLHFP